MRLLSEVPLGAFLSGGIDSGLLVAAMARASPQPVNTFTIGFGGSTGNFLDERPIAREVAAQYRTRHTEFVVRPNVQEALDVALDAFDEPFADDSVIPTHHVCQQAAQHVTVVLSGLGGDENFAGYERTLGFKLSALAASAPLRPLAVLIRPLVHALREEKGGHYRVNHLKRFMDGIDLTPSRRWQSFTQVFSEKERRALYTSDVAKEIDFDAVDRATRSYFERVESGDPLDGALYQDIKLFLPDNNLALTDRVGMWHSLELRVPYIDHTLVEFCARIPASLKLRRGQKKYLLREAARHFLPQSVFNQRKQGFAAPLAAWLRGDLRAFVEDMLAEPAIARSGALQSQEVTRRLVEHRERRRLNDKQIFAMLMFQMWMRKNAASV